MTYVLNERQALLCPAYGWENGGLQIFEAYCEYMKAEITPWLSGLYVDA